MMTTQDYSAPEPSVTISSTPAAINGVPSCTLPGGLRVLEQLGLTPEGPLYRARCPSGLEVAVVILRPEANGGDPAALPRLCEWFDRAIQMQHPNVAAVHAMGEADDGFVYVVFEQLTGELLSNILKARGPLPLHEAADLCLQAAAGLQAAHEVGFVHGNLSPLAILVTQEDNRRPRVKLIRFALPPSVLRQGAEGPLDGELSPEYASPERLDGRAPDARSDVFSLGAVLHHLLTGVPPGSESEEGSIPGAMRAVVSRALAPVPAQRFQTISELATALERAAAAAGRVRKGRFRVLLAAGAALLVMAAGLWMLENSDWPAPPPARPEPPRQPAAALPRAPNPAPPPLPARHEAPYTDSMRTAAVAATAKLDEERRRPRATQPAPVSDEVPADGADGSIESGVMPASIPEPEPTPPTLEERAQVYLRIGLDEASRQLGEPAHAIEGMSPTFIGLAEGRLLSGADTSRPVVRAVYLDPNGNLILLDQQQIRPGQPAPVATPDLWSIGSVLVSLHGEVPPQAISNLRSRLH